MTSTVTSRRSASPASASKIPIGVIGCGRISDAYLDGWAEGDVDIAGRADLDPTRAQAQATQHGLHACTVDGLLADATIAIVVNLTIPPAHLSLNERAFRAGKHVHVETGSSWTGRSRP